MITASDLAATYLADVDERLTLVASALDAYLRYRRHLSRTPEERERQPLAFRRVDERLGDKLASRWEDATSQMPFDPGSAARRAIRPYALPIEVGSDRWNSSALTAADELRTSLLDTQAEVLAKLRSQEASATVLDEPTIRLLTVKMTFTMLRRFIHRLAAHLDYAAGILAESIDATTETPGLTCSTGRALFVHRHKRMASINGVLVKPFLGEMAHYALGSV